MQQSQQHETRVEEKRLRHNVNRCHLLSLNDNDVDLELWPFHSKHAACTDTTVSYLVSCLK